MSKLRILYAATEIDPFLHTTKVAELLRHLPAAMQESGAEVRIFVPRFGIINERKNHSAFQLIIITHDENFLRKLGHSDVMEYYWYSLLCPLSRLRVLTTGIGAFRETRGRNLSLNVNDSAEAPQIITRLLLYLLH